jgi:argininosuccinate lyase
VEIRRDAFEAAASDPLVLATDAAEALVADGVPFRDAYTQVAASVKNGSFEPAGDARASIAARHAPGPGAVAAAIAAARARLSA